MTLPPEYRNARIAVDVPCRYGTTPCIPADEWDKRPGPPCDGCLGDGWRTVISDVKIERASAVSFWAGNPFWREVVEG